MSSSTTCVIAVVGGDRRQAAAARALARMGFHVQAAALPGLAVTEPAHALDGADVWLLPPTPIGADGLVAGGTGPGAVRVTLEVLLRLRPGALLLSGALDAAVAERVAAAGVRHVNYAEREDFAQANAILTAEGTLAHLIAVRGLSLAGTPLAVLGYGRCGQALARRAADWGAEVRVVARSEATRWTARTAGFAARGFDHVAAAVADARVVVNTVPAPVLDAEALRHFGAGTFVVDLASAPGGVDWDAARQLGVEGETLAGVPGRLLPEPAGRVVAESVARLLRERMPIPGPATGGNGS